MHTFNLPTHRPSQVISSKEFTYLVALTNSCTMLTRTLLFAIALLFSGLASAQFHNILTHPDPVAYTSVAESGDYGGERLIASTVATGSGPMVRIARVKNNGDVSWEQDYSYISGLRAKHIVPIDSLSAVLIALRDPSTAIGGATPARTVLMRFNVHTGAVLATSEIQELSPLGAEKGLVALHGIYSNQSLILTGWLGGGTGVYLQEDRYAIVASVSVPVVGSNDPVSVNWITGLNSPYSNLAYGDHDMGAHIVEVPNSGYFISGSANYIYANSQGIAEHHQSVLSAHVGYTGAITWAKSVALDPVLSTDPRVERHIVGSSAATIITTDNTNDVFEIAQTCNWTRNKGLAVLRYDLNGNILFSPLALHIDGAYTFDTETSLKGYTTYRFAGDNNANTIAVAGYANNPEYLNSNAAAGPKDRIPFLLRLDITATTGALFIQDQHFYSGNPSTDYGDDPGIFAANSRAGQQPIIFHPEMMDLAETTTGGFNIIGHRRTHEYVGPDDFDPDVILTDGMGFDSGVISSFCPEFLMPMTLELPGYNTSSLESVTVSLSANLTFIESTTVEQDVVPCEDYFTCDVELNVALHTDTCDFFTLTVSNLGSTPMSQLQLSFDHGNDGTTEQSGTADGSDGSGNPSFSASYPEGATDVKVTLTCQGVDYVHIETITRDCPDDADCVVANDMTAALTTVNFTLCTTEISMMGVVTPVAGASISWTFGGNPVPAANGQWTHAFTETFPELMEGDYVDFICATVTCPDGSSLTKCADISLSSAFPDLGLNLFLNCGSDCWFSTTGTSAGVTIDSGLWDLDAAIYGADVNFSDGSTFSLNLNSPVSIITCFGSFSLFKTACLKVYLLSDPSCYTEFCDTETCVTIGPIDFSDILSHTLPELSFDPVSCSLEVGERPTFVESTTELQLFPYNPEEDDLSEFVIDFLIGVPPCPELTSCGADPSTLGYGFQSGSYVRSGSGSFTADINTPIIYADIDASGALTNDLSNFSDVEALVVWGRADIQTVGIAVGNPGDTYLDGVDDLVIVHPDYLDGIDDLVIVHPDYFPSSGWSFQEGACGVDGVLGLDNSENIPILGGGPNYDDNGLLTSYVEVSGDEYDLFGQTIPITEANSICPSSALYYTEINLIAALTAVTSSGPAVVFGLDTIYLDNILIDGAELLESTPNSYSGMLSIGATGCDWVTMMVLTDQYPAETTWEVADANGNVAWSGGPYADLTTAHTESTCLGSGCYTLSFYDSYGDGICCDYGTGEYSLSLADGTVLASGGAFASVDTSDFCINFIPPTLIAVVDTTCDAVFTHESMAAGLIPGSTPGTYVYTEDDINLGFETFFDGSGMTYGTAMVTSAISGAGSGNVLTTSNILAVYDLSAFPNVIDVSFEFFDGAGIENLVINGGTLHTGELESMPTNIAPGVTMSVSFTNYPGYQVGLVELTGNVQKIEVGGQQFYVDHVCVHHDGEIIPIAGNTSSCPTICDAGTDFDSLTLGDKYGDPAAGATIAVPPGGYAVDSDGIPMYLNYFLDAFGGSSYHYAEVDGSPGYGFGTIQTMRTQNITIDFDIQSAMPFTDSVCIEFIDYGGYENFSINGVPLLISPNGYGGLTAFDGATIGGVDVTVTGFKHLVPGTGVVVAFEGEIVLIGDVNRLSIGGQELWLDNLCISGGNDVNDNNSNTASCPDTCDYGVTFDLWGMGEEWGNVTGGPSSHPVLAGGFMFNEGGINLYADSLFSQHYPNGYYKNVITTSPVASFGNGYVMHTNNATVEFELTPLDIDTVCLHMLDLGGYEYLEINGVGFSSLNMYGGLMAAPSTMGGVSVQVTGFPIEQMVGGIPQTVGYQMQLHLYGDVNKLQIGGQEFWIDDLCISTGSPAITLEEADETIGQDGLLELITMSIVTDTSSCQMAISLGLGSGFPAVESIGLTVVGGISGMAYTPTVLMSMSIVAVVGGSNDPGTLSAVAIEYGLIASLMALPDTTDINEPLVISLTISDATYYVDLTIPGFVIPGCPGGDVIDIPCIAQAHFIHFDYGNCDLVALTYTGTPGILSWTLNGIPAGADNSITSNLGEGVHLICVTVTDFNDPGCTSTYCEEIVITCPNDDGSECPNRFSHESMPGGPVAIPGAGVVVATEDNIDLSFEVMTYLDGSTNFGSASIGAPLVGAGDGKVLYLNNIMAHYDLSAFTAVTGVEFEYHDAGGLENLRINGDLYIGDLSSAPTVLGGAAVSVAFVDYGWYEAGIVTIVGAVGEVSVAGQEFYVDNVCVTGDPQNPGIITCAETCEHGLDFESLPLNATYGAITGIPAGGYAFTEDGIDVFVDSLLGWVNTYNFMKVVYSPEPTFGTNQVLNTNNARAVIDLNDLATDTVCFEFLDLGGYENIAVNGDLYITANGYGNLMGTPINLGGTFISVTGTDVLSASGMTMGFQGEVIIIGNVNQLEIGGQEFWIDNICISTTDELPTSNTIITGTPADDLVNLITPTVGSVANDSCAFVLVANDWAQGLNSMTSDNVQVNYMLISNTTGDTLLTASDISSLTVSGLGDDTWLAVSIISFDLNLIWEFDLPGIVIPGCGTDDFPCSTFADFAWVDMGNCGNGILMFTGNASGGFLTWTIEGSMTGGGTSFFHDFGGEGAYLVCVTVNDIERPECTTTHCDYIYIFCPNESETDSCAYGFGHESMALGVVTTSGAGVVVATEDDIDLSFEDYHLSGTTMFGNAVVDMAVTGAGWNHVLNTGNILAVYDISNYVGVSGVSFDYFDGDGVENLRINGVLYEGQLNAAPATLGGVSITVFETAYTGYRAGRVELTGNVTELGIGGQQFYVDDICVTADGVNCVDTDQDNVCDNDELPGCTNSDSPNYNPNATDDDGSCLDAEWDDQTENVTCPDECDHVVDFESQALGAVWENPGTPAFIYMFTENGIDIFSSDLNSALYGAFYNRNEVMLSPRPGFGSNHVMMTNNAGITLELDDLPTDTVCFEFLDMGGFETLEINGANFSSVNGYGGLQAAPITLGGVGVKVTGTPIIHLTSSGAQQVGFQGKIELYGDVDKLMIAGQELWVDNFCLSDGVEAVAGCTYPDADNYSPAANEEDGSCTFPVQSCEGDLDGDGEVLVSDLLMFLSVFATECESPD